MPRLSILSTKNLENIKMDKFVKLSDALDAALSCTDSYEPPIVDVIVEAIVSKLRNLPFIELPAIQESLKYMEYEE